MSNQQRLYRVTLLCNNLQKVLNVWYKILSFNNKYKNKTLQRYIFIKINITRNKLYKYRHIQRLEYKLIDPVSTLNGNIDIY